MIDTLMSLAVQCDLCEEHTEWPLGVFLAKVTLHCERHQRIDHDLLSILLYISRSLSPMIDSAPQVHQVTVKVGMRDGRCQIAI